MRKHDERRDADDHAVVVRATNCVDGVATPASPAPSRRAGGGFDFDSCGTRRAKASARSSVTVDDLDLIIGHSSGTGWGGGGPT